MLHVTAVTKLLCQLHCNQTLKKIMRSRTGPQYVFSSQESQGKQCSFAIMTLPVQFHNLIQEIGGGGGGKKNLNETSCIIRW